jgi:hypothetical protein
MATIGTPEEINPDRRRFVETAAMGIAAAGTAGLLPEHVAAAMQDNAIRPSASIANAMFAATGKRPRKVRVDCAALKQPA